MAFFMGRNSDLDGLRVLQAKLIAFPDGLYTDRSGNPCRHPAGLYSTSRSKVFQRMRALTESIRVERRPDEIRGQWPAVMSALEALFAAIESHADDLNTIIAASVPSIPKRTATKAAQLINEIFEDLVRRPYNRVRHHGEILQIRCCFDSAIAVYGYYVAGPREDGVIAYSRRAHGTTGNGWSFSVTLRRLLGQMIRASHSVERHLPASPKPELADWSEEEAAALGDIVEWICRCPPLCFPNEESLPIPGVGVRDNVPYVQLNTLKRIRNVSTRPGRIWNVQYTGDGKSTQFSSL
jgi:hypothetical protein